MDDPSLSEQVLVDLARLVGAMADSADEEAALLEQLVSGHKTYVGALRALLTGEAIPPEPNPGEGGDISIVPGQAAQMIEALGKNVADVAGALALRGQGRAHELDAVNQKEQEEKKGGGKKGGDKPGGSGTGKTATGPGGDAGGTGGGDKKDSTGSTVEKKPGTDTPPKAPDKPDSSGASTAGGDSSGSTVSGGGPASPGPTGDGGKTSGKDGAAGGPGAEKTTGKDGKKDEPKAPPKADPPTGPMSVRKGVRRCYTFWIRNNSGKPVSDFHVPRAKGVDGSFKGPSKWTRSGNVKDGSGIGWSADDEKSSKDAFPPNVDIGPFTFCSDGPPFTVDAFYSHPDGTGTKVNPGDVRVPDPSNPKKTRPAPVDNGRAQLTPTSRKYVYEIKFNSGTHGGIFTLTPNGRVQGSDFNGSSRTLTRDNGASAVIDDPRNSNQNIPPNTEVTATLLSDNPGITEAKFTRELDNHTDSDPITVKF